MSFDCAFSAFHAYPWATDAEFQSGLAIVIPSGRSAAERDDLVLRARCFYYARKFAAHVDADEYKAWLLRRTRAGSSSGGGGSSSGTGSGAVSLHEGSLAGSGAASLHSDGGGSPVLVPAAVRPCGPDEMRLSGCCVPLVPAAAAAAAAPALGSSSSRPVGPPVHDRPPPLPSASASSDPPAAAADDEASSPPQQQLSYPELVELIRAGKPVPGVREVPDTVLAGQGTASVAARRAKPWEKSAAGLAGAGGPSRGDGGAGADV